MPFDIKTLSRKLGLLPGGPQAADTPAIQGRKKSRMRITKISENFAVSPQISAEDVATIAEQGFKTIICNRPDNEEFGQPGADIIRAAAEAKGLAFEYIPVSHAGMAPDTLDKFKSAIANDDGPIFAYCRSGNRSSILWKMANA